jgi:hypothetical protein
MRRGHLEDTVLSLFVFNPRLIHFCAESVTTKHPSVGGGADILNNLSGARFLFAQLFIISIAQESVLFGLGL